MSVLAAMLSPHDADEFLRDVWTKSAVVLRGAPGKFADLFDWSSLDDYLNHRLRFSTFPVIQLFHGRKMAGQRVPPDLYTEAFTDANRAPITVVSPTKVRALCQDGASLMIHSVHDGDPRVKRFAAALEHEIGEPLRIDLFFTPPSSPGVHAHYDREDVFVLQVEGEKEWHLSPPTVEAPLEPPDLRAAQRAPAPTQRLTTRRGDVLHIPRGFWHATSTSAAPSLHLSIRVACRTESELLRWVVDELERDDPALRRNLPTRRQTGTPWGYDPRDLDAAFARVRERLAARLAEPDLAARFNRRCVRADRAAAPYSFPAQAHGDDPKLRPDATYARPRTQRAWLEPTPDGATLSAWGRDVEIPAAYVDAVRWILARERFTGEALAAACGRRFDEVAPLVGRLVLEGIVFVTNEGKAGSAE